MQTNLYLILFVISFIWTKDDSGTKKEDAKSKENEQEKEKENNKDVISINKGVIDSVGQGEYEFIREDPKKPEGGKQTSLSGIKSEAKKMKLQILANLVTYGDPAEIQEIPVTVTSAADYFLQNAASQNEQAVTFEPSTSEGEKPKDEDKDKDKDDKDDKEKDDKEKDDKEKEDKEKDDKAKEDKEKEDKEKEDKEKEEKDKQASGLLSFGRK